jgi:GGDEF domain-containing protein
MHIADITNKNTLKCIENYGIDIAPFKDKHELQVYIKLNHAKLYRAKNNEYFRAYMRERYRQSKGGKVNNYKRKPIVEDVL